MEPDGDFGRWIGLRRHHRDAPLPIECRRSAALPRPHHALSSRSRASMGGLAHGHFRRALFPIEHRWRRHAFGARRGVSGSARQAPRLPIPRPGAGVRGIQPSAQGRVRASVSLDRRRAYGWYNARPTVIPDATVAKSTLRASANCPVRITPSSAAIGPAV